MVASISLFPNGALPKLFPTVSPPSTLLSLPSLPSRSFRAALPKLFLTVSPPSTLSSLPSRSFSTNSPSYFPGLPLRPPCRRFHLAPSQRNSPQAISNGFPSVLPVVASISLLPNGTLPTLFPTASSPSTLSSLPSRSFPTELSPTYFPRFPFRPSCRRFHLLPYLLNGALPKLFSTASPSSPCGRFHLAPSQQLFPTVSPRSTLSLLPFRSFPTELSPSYFRRPPCRRRVSRPSTLSSLPSRSFPTELSPSYFPRFPLRPHSRRFRIASLRQVN